MKKTLLHLPLSIALFLSTTVAQASLDMWKSATVKVISTPCLVQKPRFEGSGLVVRLQNRLFVLTSEHVIIDDSSSRLCHAVKNSENAETPAKLLRSDFMMGMALLELSADSTYGAVAIDVNSLEDLPNAAGSLTALGFPAGDSQLQVHQQGRLISSDSQRALIPMVSKMLEVDGLLVEFGFSGGVLTDETHNTFAGMITHQYLRRESGRPTKPGGLNGDSGEAIRPGDLALVIPAATVMDWLRSSLKVSQNNDWHRRADSQLMKENEVCLQVLCFSLKNQTAGDLLEIGGDGAGVGGDDSGKGSGEVLQTIMIRLDPLASNELRGQKISDAFLEDIRQTLLNGQAQQQKVFIPFLKPQDSKRLTSFDSLEKFFTQWQRQLYVPVVLKSASADPSNEVKKRIEAARHVARLAQEQKEKSTDESQKQWLSSLRDQVLLVENNLADRSVVEGLLKDDNEPYWNNFYQTDFDAAVKLEGTIQKLISVM